jgi:hypothetical protein
MGLPDKDANKERFYTVEKYRANDCLELFVSKGKKTNILAIFILFPDGTIWVQSSDPKKIIPQSLSNQSI